MFYKECTQLFPCYFYVENIFWMLFDIIRIQGNIVPDPAQDAQESRKQDVDEICRWRRQGGLMLARSIDLHLAICEIV